jgi:hypothetical protein
MHRTGYRLPYTCARCLRAAQRHHASRIAPRTSAQTISQLSPLRNAQQNAAKIEENVDKPPAKSSITIQSNPSSQGHAEQEQGAMSRRLAQATEDALLEGGRAGRKAVEEAGFSDELKTKLLERIEAAKFRSDNAAAFAEAGISSNVGRGSRDIATGQAWTGTEAQEDTVLRMLDDARKPLNPGLRGPSKLPVVDLRPRGQPRQKPGQRLANARDRTSIYAISKDSNMSEKEREEMRRELKERFTPGARAMPNSIRGLAALANERIEDAIARGQFKVCPFTLTEFFFLIFSIEYSPWESNRKRHESRQPFH